MVYHYLDPEILRHELLRGLADLHAQPPVFNAFLGVVLKLAGSHANAVFAASYELMAAGLSAGLAWLFALHPTSIVHGHWLFYTLPVQLLLVAGAVVLVRFVDGGRARSAYAFVWFAARLLLTRSLYHVVWLVAVLAGLAVGAARRASVRCSSSRRARA